MSPSRIHISSAGNNPTTRTGETSKVTENRTMEHYNESTLDTSKLKGLKTYCYTTKTFGDIFFSLVPFYKQDIFIASTTPDMDDAWITGDLEAFGQPI